MSKLLFIKGYDYLLGTDSIHADITQGYPDYIIIQIQIGN